MIVPQFRCFQDDASVRLEMRLSELCKVTEAQFDILDRQFTFSCAPFFLRLTFPNSLTEGQGEYATFDAETNVMTVHLPKLNRGEEFPNLEFPNQLLATARQRRQNVVVRGGDRAAGVSATTGPPHHKSVEDEADAEEQEELLNNGDDADADDGGVLPGVTASTAGIVVAPVNDNKKKEDDDELEDEEDDNDGDGDSNDSEMDALETEFDLHLHIKEQHERENTATVSYGFDNRFNRFFAALETGGTKDLVDVPNPDTTLPLERKRLRREHEDANYEEDAFLYSMDDEDDEVGGQMLPFKPWYVVEFEAALRRAGRPLPPAAPAPAQQQQRNDERDEDDDDDEQDGPTNDAIAVGQPANQGPTVIWRGNLMPELMSSAANASASASATTTAATNQQQTSQALQPTPPLVENPFAPQQQQQAQQPPPQVQQAQQRSTKGGLAFALPPPPAILSLSQATALATIPRRRFNTISHGSNEEQQCLWAMCDILAATVYDIVTTQGSGNVESSWTVTKLSTCLSWLDPPSDAKEFADTFCRRVLVYPLHRHLGLALRCLRDVSVLLLSGPRTCVKLLLHTKALLDGCDSGKHCLSALWINPMLSWLTSSQNQVLLHERMTKTADQLHAYVVRGEVEEKEPQQPQPQQAAAGNTKQKTEWGTAIQPLAWTTLGLPFSKELMEQCA